MSDIIYPESGDCMSLELQELRQRIPDVIKEFPDYQQNFYLYFWLRDAKFNVDRAETYIRETVKWRKLNHTDVATREDFNPEIAKSFQIYMDGKTRSGMLAWTVNAGRFKFRETVSRHGKDEVLYYWLQHLLKAERIAVECNKEIRRRFKDIRDMEQWPLIQKHLLIINLEGMDYRELLSKSTISVFLALAKMAVNYFPTLEGTVIFINSGKFMEMFFRLLRPLLKGSNVDMLVYDSTVEKWQPFIHKYVDPSQVRPSFGGYKEDV